MTHGMFSNECLTLYCQLWTIIEPEIKIKPFLRKWKNAFAIYAFDFPDDDDVETTNGLCVLKHSQMAALLHFFAKHGRCIIGDLM